jgi:hypothetical protein
MCRLNDRQRQLRAGSRPCTARSHLWAMCALLCCVHESIELLHQMFTTGVVFRPAGIVQCCAGCC